MSLVTEVLSYREILISLCVASEPIEHKFFKVYQNDEDVSLLLSEECASAPWAETKGRFHGENGGKKKN